MSLEENLDLINLTNQFQMYKNRLTDLNNIKSDVLSFICALEANPLYQVEATGEERSSISLVKEKLLGL
jgi:hypothetical protein